jgi:hypothetical protein
MAFTTERLMAGYHYLSQRLLSEVCCRILRRPKEVRCSSALRQHSSQFRC